MITAHVIKADAREPRPPDANRADRDCLTKLLRQHAEIVADLRILLELQAADARRRALAFRRIARLIAPADEKTVPQKTLCEVKSV